MNRMSNNQWNNDASWQGQQSAQDWDAANNQGNEWQAQASASDPQAQNWGGQQQGDEYSQANVAAGWDQQQGAQQQPVQGEEYSQANIAAGWDQQQGGQQGYGQQQGAYGQQQWGQQQQQGGGAFGALFDFKFLRGVAPHGIGVMYMVVLIALGVRHLLNFIGVAISDYAEAWDIISSLIQNVITFLVWIIIIRVVFEGMNAIVKLYQDKKD